jgi:membrane protease YdiL (CAAX protease family)
MREQPVASTRHTIIFLAIFALLFAAGLNNARAARPAAPPHLPFYAGAVAMQALLAYFIHRGVQARGHSLGALFGKARAPLVVECAIGVAAAVVIRAILHAVRLRMGFIEDHTSALLPRGAAEMCIWVLVAIAAGVCEELAFRGYLQRQFTAFTGSRIVAAMVQCVVFGVAHGYQGAKPILLTALFGALVTLLTMWRGSLFAAAVAHATVDLAAGLWR